MYIYRPCRILDGMGSQVTPDRLINNININININIHINISTTTTTTTTTTCGVVQLCNESKRLPGTQDAATGCSEVRRPTNEGEPSGGEQIHWRKPANNC